MKNTILRSSTSIALVIALVQSSAAPAFSQTIRVVPGQGAGLPGIQASAAAAFQGPSSIRFNAGLAGAVPSGSLVPLAAPGAGTVLESALPSLPSLPALTGPALAPAEAPVQAAVPQAAPASELQSKLVPGVELSDYASEKLGRLPDSGAHEAGTKLSDAVIGVRAAPASGDVEGAAVSAAPRTGLQPAQLKKIDPATRPYSPWRLSTFLQDPEKYAMLFIFGADDQAFREVRGYELLVGDAVHQAFESVYKRVQAGTPGKDIKLDEALAVYAKVFDEGHKSGGYTERSGWKASEYKRRGTDYIKTRFGRLAPFESQGKVLAIEERVFWTMKDPATGKSYDFKGRIDRLMLKGDTVYIRDWKTHFAPPTLTQLERDDFQLGLYALGLVRTRPDLVKGRKLVIAWDFKEFTQEIVVDEAYLARTEAQVLDILRRIEVFTARVEAEKPEWLKRLGPDSNPAGAARARAAVDELGKMRDGMDAKASELRALRREYKNKEEGVTRYALRMKQSQVKGKRYTLDVAKTKEEAALPTKTDDLEGYEEVVRILKEGGAWDSLSSLDAASVRKAVEALGGDDHQAFEKLKALIKSGHLNEVETYLKNAKASGGGVVRPKIERDAIAPDSQPGVLSPTQLDVFLRDETEYAERYIVRMREEGPKAMGTLAGSVIHGTMEQLYVWIKGGREVADIHYNDLMKFFDARWEEEKAQGAYVPDKGVSEADYIKGSKEYVKAKWDKLYPFDLGRPVFLEKRMFFTLTDPKTGRTYKFQGIPDRVMIEGDTVVIRDWKSHYKEPTAAEVKAKDYQLGLYVLALRQLYPDLMKGRKARLVWDFKSKEVVIDVDDQYLQGLEKRLFAVLRRMDSFKAKVESQREKWEEELGLVTVPRTKKAAADAVDGLGRLADKIVALEDALAPLKEKEAALETEVAAFSSQTGWVRVHGSEYSSKLVKRGNVAVPTKGRERQAYDQVTAILKAAGVWEKYSSLDYSALRKALADPDHPDRAVLEKLEPLLKDIDNVKVKLSKTLKKDKPRKKKASGRKASK
ncbi:MAG: PD-(D/E)XK nuclease family protein [Elusimicrobia bacterium]|nr:PD-(D/E)XK nuclease family protein [Elusimicrobiota bacterium]